MILKLPIHYEYSLLYESFQLLTGMKVVINEKSRLYSNLEIYMDVGMKHTCKNQLYVIFTS